MGYRIAMKNVAGIKNCYGCGVCSLACSKNIIDLKLSKDGFYIPYIKDEAKCVGCGLCIDVCSFNDLGSVIQETPLCSYAAWSNEFAIQRKCSSGGVSFEVGRYLLKEGYKVFGVRYNVDTSRAEHYIASSPEELIHSIGSKYIQSYTIDGLAQIDKKNKYLVTGTPCQIASFRKFIQRFHCEDNFVLMDFFCHGVPSMLAWKKYVNEAEAKVGKLTYVSWRNKFTGWHDSWAMTIDGEICGEKIDWHDSYNILIQERKGYLNSRLSKGDTFYRLFLENQCLGLPCYDCRFKYNRSAADIRIGDLWGNTFKNNEDGVSCAIAYTEKGRAVLHGSNLQLNSLSFDVVAEGQMKSSPNLRKRHRNAILKTLRRKNTTTFDALVVSAKMDIFEQKLFILKHPRVFWAKLKNKLFGM